jgi:protease-4
VSRNRWILVVALAVLLLVACACAALLAAWLPRRGEAAGFFPRLGGDAVAIVPVEGAILYGRAPAFGQTSIAYSERVVEDLRRAEADPTVAAVVLDVNSPGGSVVASADIHRALTEMTKPVVTSMGEVAASGGYYIACGTEHIVARPETTTGSIGVISQLTNVEDLLEMLGVRIYSITSGPMKDLGSPFDELTAEEYAIYQRQVLEAYDGFVAIVAEGRDMPEERVREIADGRIYSGRQALDLGLIDTLGNLDDAVAIAGELGGIAGEPRTVRYDRPPGFLDVLLFGSTSRSVESRIIEAILGEGTIPRLQYLYTGP